MSCESCWGRGGVTDGELRLGDDDSSEYEEEKERSSPDKKEDSEGEESELSLPSSVLVSGVRVSVVRLDGKEVAN